MNNLMNEFQQLIITNNMQKLQDTKYIKLKNYYDDLGMAAVHYALQYDNKEAFIYILKNFHQLHFLTKKKIFMYKNKDALTSSIQQTESKLYNNEPQETIANNTQKQQKSKRKATQNIFCYKMTCPQYRLPEHSSILIFACAANSENIINHLLMKFNEGNKKYLSLLGLQNDLGINALQTCLLTKNYKPINNLQLNQDEEQCDLNIVTNDVVLRKELCQVTKDNLTTLMIAGFCKRVKFIQFIQRLYAKLINDKNGDSIYRSYIIQMILKQDNGFTCVTAAENNLDPSSEAYYLAIYLDYSQQYTQILKDCGIEMRKLYGLVKM